MRKYTLAEARDLVGLSQRALDMKSGVRVGTVYQIESDRNKRPAFVTVTKIMRALHAAGLKGVSAEQIFNVDSDDLTTEQQADVA
jgi:transcriptional regulator with XRE-family HTH domain